METTLDIYSFRSSGLNLNSYSLIRYLKIMKILKHISKGFLIILSLEIVGCLYLIIQANLKESGNDGTIGIWNLGWSFFLITKYIIMV